MNPSGLAVGMALLAAGLLALMVLLLRSASGDAADRRRTKAVLRRYSTAAPSAAGPVSDALPGATARTVVEFAGRITRRRGHEELTARQLDRAGLRLTPAEWLVLRAAVSLAASAVAVLLFRSTLAALVLAGIGWLVTRAFIQTRANRRLTAYRQQLPDSLRLIASGLLSGYSFPQALDALVREGSQPMAGEISRALAEARLGVPVEDALDQVADRMDSTDTHWAVMAVRVQREVGGNLAEVLNTVSDTVRERAYLRRQVKTLSAEGRLSAYVLVALPVLFGSFTYLFRRTYMSVLWTTTPGVVMSLGALGLVAIGIVWMRRLVDLEV